MSGREPATRLTLPRREVFEKPGPSYCLEARFAPRQEPPSIVLRYLHDDVYSCLTGALSRCDHQLLPS